MRIWFDITNSPHVNLFLRMIRDLQSAHDVIVTSRPLANTGELLALHGVSHTVVGKHYGRALMHKVRGYPVRVWELYRFLRGRHIDVAISQSSFHSPVVARLLGVRSIYLNDNEHAMGNIPSFLFASKIMVPEFFPVSSLRLYCANPRKVVRYPGVKEGIYLWHVVSGMKRAEQRSAADRSRPSVYVRPEPSTAQYYRGGVHVLDPVLLGLKDRVRATLLPRSAEQAQHYAHPKFVGVHVLTGAADISDIVPDCDLFIGAGGTMTREMAVLGVPTISVYQDELLEVDRYLASRNGFLHRPALTAEEALRYLDACSRRPPHDDLLRKGREAYDLIKAAVLTPAGRVVA